MKVLGVCEMSFEGISGLRLTITIGSTGRSRVHIWPRGFCASGSKRMCKTNVFTGPESIEKAREICVSAVQGVVLNFPGSLLDTIFDSCCNNNPIRIKTDHV